MIKNIQLANHELTSSIIVKLGFQVHFQNYYKNDPIFLNNAPDNSLFQFFIRKSTFTKKMLFEFLLHNIE